MARMLAMCMLPALALAQGGTHGEVEFADSPLGGFEKKDVSFSFYLSCHDSCFVTTSSGQKGTFDREAFRKSMMTAFNAVASVKRQELLAQLTAEHPNGQFATFAAETYPDLSDSFEPGQMNTIYNNIKFDRVVESTDSSDKFGRVKTVGTGGEVVPSNFWNVFVRVTMTNIPEAMADNFNDVIINLSAEYPAQINFDSLWVNTDAFFITDQLEPVRGRGHKSTRLLIPLLMGIVAMLVVPMIVSAALVHAAQRAKKDQDRIDGKDKELVTLNRSKVERDQALNTFSDREKEVSSRKEQEIEMKKLRDTTELQEEDVDWAAKEAVKED